MVVYPKGWECVLNCLTVGQVASRRRQVYSCAQTAALLGFRRPSGAGSGLAPAFGSYCSDASPTHTAHLVDVFMGCSWGTEPLPMRVLPVRSPGNGEWLQRLLCPAGRYQAPLEARQDQEVAVITTYERDSIWQVQRQVVKYSDLAIELPARRIKFGGKTYRYQLVSRAEPVRLLKNPLGGPRARAMSAHTIPIHRISHPRTV